MRIKLTVAYDGTEFRGWAPQAGQRTVQGTLREAVRLISGEEVEITGASRTDSGAHARGQVCHFDTKSPMPTAKWARVLNKRLPSDLAVVSATVVDESFHSRFCAMDRFYRYRIQTGVRDPHRTRFAHWYGRPLDIPAMQIGAGALTGEHDFLAFTEELEPHVINTRRELFSFRVRQVRDEVWLDVVGTAFLRGMMRRMAGALLEVGRGYRDVAEVSKLLHPEERMGVQLPVVLPANGLCLMQVRYGRFPKDNRTTTIEPLPTT
ncbi:tRNA pseudouridine(38-40) synthase TruA [Fimbriimonas ginsengisoli]|uniref:tRNA pseudouridine synthase A n=1 Tax=Fimbriimonas ginsengisoli Gsoil 348 TaxID=661478 RepID=A0A068NK74_FIMGI|nr:tRNA pseudouridine(38-40) synthase TruA [Fimbriimonas ginsengisoli]AIE83978.1 tRNA pseudouridine synthase A [Fimbriimonas ginsengisoli Gsoil 348]